MKLNTALCETTRVLLNFPHPCPSNSKDNIVGLKSAGPVFQPALTSVCSWHLRRQKRFIVLHLLEIYPLSFSICYRKQSHRCLQIMLLMILLCCSICPQAFAMICHNLAVKSELVDLLLFLYRHP